MFATLQNNDLQFVPQRRTRRLVIKPDPRCSCWSWTVRLKSDQCWSWEGNSSRFGTDVGYKTTEFGVSYLLLCVPHLFHPVRSAAVHGIELLHCASVTNGCIDCSYRCNS